MTDGIQSRGTSYLHPNSPTFGRVDAALIVRTFEASVRRFRRTMLGLVDDLTADSIDVSSFTRAANRLIRTEFGIAFSLGALSIDPFHVLTVRDIRVIDQEVSEERRFIKSFAEDLKTGSIVLSATQRAGLYLQALRGAFELGRMEALPAGPYIWELGPTEHCIPCLEASVGGPYQREQFSGLGLPVVPGIPGSGDICRGLTRCGCRIKIDGRPIPNEDIQLEVKHVLAEVLNDSS